MTNSAQETQLVQCLQKYLGNNAIPNSYHATDTIGTIRQSNHTLIIFMNTNQAVSDPSAQQFSANDLWNESTIDSPWPNATTVVDLKNTLDTEMAFRDKTYASANNFFVLQSIQTENTNEIIDGILDPNAYPSTMAQFELPVNQLLNSWMNTYISDYGPQPVNIILQDWFTSDSALVPLAIQYDTESFAAKSKMSNGLRSKLMQLKRWYRAYSTRSINTASSPSE